MNIQVGAAGGDALCLQPPQDPLLGVSLRWAPAALAHTGLRAARSPLSPAAAPLAGEGVASFPLIPKANECLELCQGAEGMHLCP